ncbi:MAG TPA: DUF433 domain-containing protein [Thermoanaerobaculia bacterium]|jgi:uncharacterized protein (DUF433 family)|nr:DUF433 domain-containing protein [Thermoanaerobaculia bacterium]
MAEIAPRIVVDPNILVGKPVIKGTRVPVEIVIGQLAAGLTIDEVADAYGITREDVLAALAYAASVISLEEIILTG